MGPYDMGGKAVARKKDVDGVASKTDKTSPRLAKKRKQPPLFFGLEAKVGKMLLRNRRAN